MDRIKFIKSNVDALNDEFFKEIPYDFEFFYFNYLKSKGFERVLFYNSVDGLYSFEEASFKKRKKRKLSSLIGEEEKEELKLQRNMPVSEMLKFVETFMKGKKNAFIFSDVLSLITHMNESELRELNQLVLDWKKLPVDNESIVIFLEPSNFSLNELKNKLLSFRGIDNLTSEFFMNLNKSDVKIKNIEFIDLPYDDEIRSLLNYLRLNSKEVNWIEFDEIVDLLHKYSKQNKVLLKDLHFKLKDLKTISLKEVEEKFGLKKELSGWNELDGLRGVDDIKKEIKKLVEFIKNQKKEEKVEVNYIKRFSNVSEPFYKSHLNILLTGNPGTGKTTIAKIIGKIFKEEGILPYGQFIKVSKSDLVGQYVGETAIKTREKIKEALGGVLFIDEAYALSDDEHYGKEAINELVDAMSEYEGRICVIAAGYENEMKEFLKSNPGLSSRFRTKIKIEDYTPDVLESIFRDNLKKFGVKISKELEEVIPLMIERFYNNKDKNSGNARSMEALAEGIRKNQIILKDDEFKVSHIPTEYKKLLPAKYQNLKTKLKSLEKLDKLIGLDGVKKEIRTIVNKIRVERLRGGDVRVGHYAFVGNPGTGKTTVARIVYDVFKEMNLIDGKFISINGSELTAGYVGQTKDKVKEILEEAKGGVLFIDEAYSLMHGGDFAKEAVAMLIQEMENSRGKFSVILAGYPKEIDKLLSTNPGFKSRIQTIYFEDYNLDEMMEIFEFMLKEQNLKIEDNAKDKVKEILKEILKNKSKDFANARVVRNLIETFKNNQANRLSKLIENGIDVEKEVFLLKEEDVFKLKK